MNVKAGRPQELTFVNSCPATPYPELFIATVDKAPNKYVAWIGSRTAPCDSYYLVEPVRSEIDALLPVPHCELFSTADS